MWDRRWTTIKEYAEMATPMGLGGELKAHERMGKTCSYRRLSNKDEETAYKKLSGGGGGAKRRRRRQCSVA